MGMYWLLPVFVLIAVLVVAGILRKRWPARTLSAEPLYTTHNTLVSPAERALLGVLDLAAAEHYRVFAKVRVADLLAPRSGLPQAERNRAFNRIQSKHVDFVICDRETLSIVCAVELDDASHRRTRRRQRDEFLASAFEAAGLPLVSIPARSGYSIGDVRSKLASALAPKPVSRVPTQPPLGDK
jgi:hypothetical protein